MNRSKAFNPFGYDLGQMAIHISEEIKKGQYEEDQIQANINIFNQMINDPKTTPDVKDGAKQLIDLIRSSINNP